MEACDYLMLIRAHGLTQQQVAEKTGIAQQTISRLERGDVTDVRSRNYRALQALSDALGAAPAVLAPEAKAA